MHHILRDDIESGNETLHIVVPRNHDVVDLVCQHLIGDTRVDFDGFVGANLPARAILGRFCIEWNLSRYSALMMPNIMPFA